MYYGQLENRECFGPLSDTNVPRIKMLNQVTLFRKTKRLFVGCIKHPDKWVSEWAIKLLVRLFFIDIVELI